MSTRYAANAVRVSPYLSDGGVSDRSPMDDVANTVIAIIIIIIINVKINVALSENASRTRYTIKIKLKLRK